MTNKGLNFGRNNYLVPFVEGESAAPRHTAPTRGISRPVEDYVIAKLTIQERLTRLTPTQYAAVLMSACGFSMAAWAELRGTCDSNENQAKLNGLKKVRAEQGRPRPGPCSECGESPTHAYGLCHRCYRRHKRHSACLPKEKPTSCGECGARQIKAVGLCTRCYNAADYQRRKAR